MKALIWKDFHINMFVLAYGVVILLAPLAAFTAVNLYAGLRYERLVWSWSELLIMNACFGMALQLLTAAMLGGCAVAAERADRSAEFLAYLPPSRWAIITSKAVLAVGAGTLIWLVELALAHWFAPFFGPTVEDIAIFREQMTVVLTPTAVLLFGAAWCASTVSPSHAIATGVGIAAPIALLAVLLGVEYFFNPRAFDLGSWYRPLCVVLGIAAFIAGIVYYVRRVEP
jgi:ABC-type transport system involved in multi-copper enzyme maturation permease subunit